VRRGEWERQAENGNHTVSRLATSPTYYLFSVCAVLIECLLLSVLMRLISVLFLSLILTGWTWLIPYHLLGTYPTFFNLFSLIRAFSDQISKTDVY